MKIHVNVNKNCEKEKKWNVGKLDHFIKMKMLFVIDEAAIGLL